MSVSTFIERCMAAGMPFDMALKAAKAFETGVEEAVGAALEKLSDHKDEAAERRRAKDRERKSAAKARKSADSAVSAEIRGNPQTDAEIQPENDALTRVVDKPLTGLDILPNPTTPHGASDALAWPGVPPAKPELDALEAALTEAAGSALASVAVAPRLRVLAPILSLAKPGTGPPCDLQADVLPVIRARSASAKPGSVRSWEFFTAAILEARDRRLSGAPQVQAPTHDRQPSRPDRPARPNPREDRIERMLAGAVASIDG